MQTIGRVHNNKSQATFNEIKLVEMKHQVKGWSSKPQRVLHNKGCRRGSIWEEYQGEEEGVRVFEIELKKRGAQTIHYRYRKGVLDFMDGVYICTLPKR